MTPPDERAERRRERLVERAAEREQRLAEKAQQREERLAERAVEREERLAEKAVEREERLEARAEERREKRALRRLDKTALQGLAHPLRVQLYDALVVNGSATASELGRRLGESSGATSYHLRQLERHGFVETDPDRGTGRERWWRATAEDTQLRGTDFEGDPSAEQAHRLVAGEWMRSRQARFDEWNATRRQWPLEWRETGGDTTSHFSLDAVEAQQLFDELQEVLVRWASRLSDTREQDPRYRPVEVQLSIFPNGPAPTGDPEAQKE